MTVRGVHEVMSGLLVRKGCLTKTGRTNRLKRI